MSWVSWRLWNSNLCLKLSGLFLIVFCKEIVINLPNSDFVICRIESWPFFHDLGLRIFFPSFPQWTIANCTHVHCVAEGGFLITHSYLLLKKLCPCALDLTSYRPDPAPAESAHIFLWGNRISLQIDEVTVAHKKQRKVWLVTQADLISITICMNMQSGSIKYLFDLLKKYMSSGAGQHN